MDDGNRIAMEPTLEQSLARVLGGPYTPDVADIGIVSSLDELAGPWLKRGSRSRNRTGPVDSVRARGRVGVRSMRTAEAGHSLVWSRAVP
jgi:hypothetical protein